MLSSGIKRGERRLGGWRIAQADRNIAQPALVADAPNGRAFGVRQKLLFGPGK